MGHVSFREGMWFERFFLFLPLPGEIRSNLTAHIFQLGGENPPANMRSTAGSSAFLLLCTLTIFVKAN